MRFQTIHAPFIGALLLMAAICVCIVWGWPGLILAGIGLAVGIWECVPW